MIDKYQKSFVSKIYASLWLALLLSTFALSVSAQSDQVDRIGAA